MIKAMFFDFGGTLFDNVTFLEKYAARADQKILKSFGYDFTLSQIQKARFKTMEYFEDRYKNSPKKHAFGLYTFYFLKYLGIKPSMKLARGVSKKFSTEWDKHKKLVPHAENLLKFVKKKRLKTAMVSNGSVEAVNCDLNQSKLRKYFDLVVISGKFGKEKSSLVPFKYALKKLKLKPEEVVVVGDRIDEDIFGGKKLGCATIRLDRGFWKDFKKGEYEEADYVVKNLKEIEHLDILNTI